MAGSHLPGVRRPLRIAVDARHLDPYSDENDLSVLGLRGDVVIHLDPQSRVPLQVSGRVPVAGTVHVRLRGALLKE